MRGIPSTGRAKTPLIVPIVWSSRLMHRSGRSGCWLCCRPALLCSRSFSPQ